MLFFHEMGKTKLQYHTLTSTELPDRFNSKVVWKKSGMVMLNKAENASQMEEHSCEGDFKSLSYCQLFGEGGICASAFIGLSKLIIH